MKRFFILATVVLCAVLVNCETASAQAFRGTTGLLHAPTAEMQKPGTFMFGGNVLDLVPMHWNDFNHEITHTYDYYVNVTFFSWFEVGYTCTLNYAYHGSTYFPRESWGHYTNQDRTFNARIRLWKEGWYRWWTPQVVLGLDDPLSHTSYGGGSITIGDDVMADNHFTRYYLAATKHLDFENVGTLGIHVAWVMNFGGGSHNNTGARDNPERFNRPAAGASFRLALPETSKWMWALNGIEAMAEYDARTFNMGIRYNLLKERFHLIAELNDFKYWSGGIYFTIPLTNSDSFAHKPDYRYRQGVSKPHWTWK